MLSDESDIISNWQESFHFDKHQNKTRDVATTIAIDFIENIVQNI